MMICDAFSLADEGLRVFYVLPTIDLRNNFVTDRIDRPLLTIPYYRQRVKPTKKAGFEVVEADNKGLKSFGDQGVLFFVGSNSPVSFISFPADVAIIDELDKCLEVQRKQTKNNLELIPGRMTASPYKYIRKISTPTIEGFGIDEAYTQSDKKHWMIKCEHCGTWQEPEFFVNVVRETEDNVFELVDSEWQKGSKTDIKIFCKKCMGEIDRLVKGEWVAEYPDRSVSGYSISQLFSAHLTIAQIYDKFIKSKTNESRRQVFYNDILGLAYTAKGTKLTKAILDECVKSGLNYNMPSRSDATTMGVDVGGPLHVVIHDHPSGNSRRLIFAGTVQEFEELHTFISRYGVQVCVMDIDPETHKAREFQKEANCEVWLCDYLSSPQQVDVILDLDKRIIKADRTQVMDALVSDYVEQTVLLPANASTLNDGEFYSQLCAPTRLLDEDTGHYFYTEGSKADHFFHAEVYEKLANEFFSPSVEVRDAQNLPPRQWFKHLRKPKRNGYV